MRTILKNTSIYTILFLIFFSPTDSYAHEPDHSYIYLRIYKESIGGRFEMTAKDMNRAMGLQLDENLSMEAITPHLAQIQSYFISRSSFGAGSEQYNVKFTEPTVLTLEDKDDYIRFHFDLEGVSKVPEVMDIGYDVLFDKVPKHRGMLIIEYNWKAGIVDNEALVSNIYNPDNRLDQLNLTDVSLWKGFKALVKLGMWHIWIGLDHILFIVALILPAVVRRRTTEDPLVAANKVGTWAPVEKFKPAFFYILKIITFFTIAHSITLALASLNIINLPSRFVESTIAISIALAAYHNIRPIFKHREWIIAFGFGLFHGFGFASVLGDKGLGGDFMTLSLLGFNLGVEIGQVLIICAIFPILYIIRKHKLYPKLITYGSVLLILISIYWFIERGFDIDLPAGAYFWEVYNSILG